MLVAGSQTVPVGQSVSVRHARGGRGPHMPVAGSQTVPVGQSASVRQAGGGRGTQRPVAVSQTWPLWQSRLEWQARMVRHRPSASQVWPLGQEPSLAHTAVGLGTGAGTSAEAQSPPKWTLARHSLPSAQSAAVAHSLSAWQRPALQLPPRRLQSALA